MCDYCNTAFGHFHGCPAEIRADERDDPYRYYRLERDGITNEGYWAAVNGTEFDEKEGYTHER